MRKNPLECYLYPIIRLGQDTCEMYLFRFEIWGVTITETASEKKTTSLWVLSRLAIISVAVMFIVIASALKFVEYLPAATEMWASSALYLV